MTTMPKPQPTIDLELARRIALLELARLLGLDAILGLRRGDVAAGRLALIVIDRADLETTRAAAHLLDELRETVGEAAAGEVLGALYALVTERTLAGSVDDYYAGRRRELIEEALELVDSVRFRALGLDGVLDAYSAAGATP